MDVLRDLVVPIILPILDLLRPETLTPPIVQLYQSGGFNYELQPQIWHSLRPEDLTPSVLGQPWVVAPDGRGMRFASDKSAYAYGEAFQLNTTELSMTFWIRNLTVSGQIEEIITLSSENEQCLRIIKTGSGIGVQLSQFTPSKTAGGILSTAIGSAPLVLDYLSIHNLTQLPAGIFTHIAITINYAPGSQKILFYQNGREGQSIQPDFESSFLAPQGPTQLRVGYPIGPLNTQFDMDRILIFQKRLTPEEISSEYEGSRHIY
jgi:hypothetical protein